MGSICPAKDMPEQVTTAHAKKGGLGYGRLWRVDVRSLSKLLEEIWMVTFPTPGVAKGKLSDPTLINQRIAICLQCHRYPINHGDARPRLPAASGSAFSGS